MTAKRSARGFDGGNRGGAVAHLGHRVAETLEHGADEQRVDLVVLGEEHVEARGAGPGRWRRGRACIARIVAKAAGPRDHLADDAKERGAPDRPDEIGVEARPAETRRSRRAGRLDQHGGGKVAPARGGHRPSAAAGSASGRRSTRTAS